MERAARREFLTQHFFLQDLPLSDIEEICDRAHVRDYASGETIFIKGEPTTGMMGVVKGCVHICTNSEDGKELILNTIHAGEIFGEIGVLDGGDRTADAVAVDPTVLLTIDQSSFLDVMRRNPEFCIILLGILCDRIRMTSEQAEDLALLNLRKRLAKKLIGISQHRDSRAEGQNSVIRLSQKELGSMMGTTREAINKQLRVWEDQGIIRLGRSEVEIVDEPMLRRIFEPIQ